MTHSYRNATIGSTLMARQEMAALWLQFLLLREIDD